MAAENLSAWLDGKRDRLVWIEFADYARQVFAGGTDDWLQVANTYVGGVSQAHGVVATEVLSIDVLAPYLAELKPADGTPAQAVEAVLQLERPQKFVGEVIDALAHRLSDHVDLVLKVPSPGELLRRLGASEGLSFDDLDDVGVALSNLLREFSNKPVTGVLVASAEPLSNDESEALESVVSAARHYQWRVALALEYATVCPAEMPEVDADLLLLPNVALSELAAAATSSLTLCGGLGAAFWHAQGEMPTAGRCLLYGAIPPDTQPELVVERVAECVMAG